MEDLPFWAWWRKGGNGSNIKALSKLLLDGVLVSTADFLQATYKLIRNA